MQDSKLILLLKTFDKEDWRWFRKFLMSPYFNSREELIILFDYLRSQSPNFKEFGLKKEKVFKKIFPKQAYSEKQLSYSMSYFLAQAERFLMQRQIEKSPPNLNNNLLNALVDRQLEKHYSFHYEKFAKNLEAYKVESLDYYLCKYQLTEIAHIHFDNQNLRKNNSFLQETHDHLNEFYFINLLKHSCELLNRKKIYGIESAANFTNHVVTFLRSQENNSPLVSIYLHIYITLKDKDTAANFEQLKVLLKQFQNILPTSEKRIIYLHLINYCIFQATQNKNASYYLEQMLEFYLFGIKNEFLFTKGYLTPWTFKNVIKLGLTLKRFDFTEDFIQQNHLKLEKEFREDALHFNLADLNYRRKKYQIAQTHLHQVQFSDLFYNIGAKAMLLKIYYETDEIEALLSLIASFSIYLRRHKKIAKETKDGYLNFTTILAQIIRATKDKIPTVIEKINNTKQLTNRSWLLEICAKK